jgi:hypothetical protein
MAYPKFAKNMHCGLSPNASNAKIARQEVNTADDGYALLAAEIVIHAVQDWRELVKGKRAGYGKNFTELRQFFQSAWCETLMQNFDIEPAELLAALEKELAEAKKKEQLEQSKKIKEAKA